MVSSISSFNPIAYIQGIVSSTTPASNSSSSSTTGSTTSGSSSATGDTTTTSGLATVLSLLQNDNSSSSNGGLLSTLLGEGGSGVSSADPLAGVYNALLYNASTIAPTAEAIANTPQPSETQTQTSPVENLINNYNTAANAYNQTLLQNAQQVAAANDQGANGTPLIA